MNEITFDKETLQNMTTEIIEICFPDKNVNVIPEWTQRWASQCDYWQVPTVIRIKKRKHNCKEIEIDIIHEIMHEIYRGLHHRSGLWKSLEETYFELLYTVRHIINGNGVSPALIKKAKNLRSKIEELQTLL